MPSRTTKRLALEDDRGSRTSPRSILWTFTTCTRRRPSRYGSTLRRGLVPRATDLPTGATGVGRARTGCVASMRRARRSLITYRFAVAPSGLDRSTQWDATSSTAERSLRSSTMVYASIPSRSPARRYCQQTKCRRLCRAFISLTRVSSKVRRSQLLQPQHLHALNRPPSHLFPSIQPMMQQLPLCRPAPASRGLTRLSS